MKNMKRKRPLSIFEFEQKLNIQKLNDLDQQMVIGGRRDALPPSQFQDMTGIKGPQKGDFEAAFELDTTFTSLLRVEEEVILTDNLEELQNGGRRKKKN